MIERRELFKILGAAAIAAREGTAQHVHGVASASINIANYKPRFFSEQQYGVIDALAENIIPTDEQSPGAHTAGVPFYIDTVLLYADAETKKHWQTGVASVDKAARAKFDLPFLQCSNQQQDQLVASLAQNEKTPSTDAEHFFVMIKEMTIDAYALSEVGMKQHFGYKGNTSIPEFPGCTHPEHRNFSA